jgi:hypothetical protein
MFLKDNAEDVYWDPEEELINNQYIFYWFPKEICDYIRTATKSYFTSQPIQYSVLREQLLE